MTRKPHNSPNRPNFRSPNWTADAIAGITNALTNIPDGLASAILIGVNPIYGLYALMIGAPLGSVFASAELMMICSTGAIAVATGSVLVNFSPEQRPAALVMLGVLIGLFQLALGLLKQGSIVRFVSNAVLTGFMTGIGISIILGQLGDLTGYFSKAGNKLASTWDLLIHLNRVDFPTTLIGIGTIALILVFSRIRQLEKFSMVLALALTTLIRLTWHPASVQIVKNVAEIPRSFPLPTVPDLALLPQLILGAISIGLIGLIQGAGVSKTVPNLNGRYGDISHDFAAQGIANLASGFFRGIPIGGSVSGTAVSMSAGAKSRWAGIFSGLFVIVIVLLFAEVVEQFPIPAIAAVLIMAGFQAIKPKNVSDVWLTGWVPRLIMLITLIATLLLPVQQAVLLGIVLSMLTYIYQSSLDIRLVELIPTVDGHTVREQPAPTTLIPHTVTMLNLYGSAFYASADILNQILPSPEIADRSVVILGLRGRDQLGSTFLKLLERYATQLHYHQSKLILVGVSQTLLAQLIKSSATEIIPAQDIIPATRELGGAMQQAYVSAHQWLNDEQ